MGSYDGAEICEIVGLFLLSELQAKYGNNIGLYRDDGLAAFNESPRTIEIIKKDICRIFANHKLKITIVANKKSVNYLDVTLDLEKSSVKPYMKPNNTPLYVHNKSNHPPNIIRSIPKTINKRLSDISSNECIFEEAKRPYKEALLKSGYNYNLKYTPTAENNRRRHNRNRNITWYNPPYSSNVKTNVGHQFLRLLDECFPKSNPLHKIINRNTVKISYSCMPNVGKIISAHNKTLLQQHRDKDAVPSRECNCRRKAECPLEGKCLQKGVIYQATVNTLDDSKQETYVGLTENTFKTRYTAHMSSFQNATQKNATALSQYIWTLKDRFTPYTIKCKILSKAKSYSPASKRCNLCLKEKLFIMYKPETSTLNSRNELVSACRHRHKYLLCAYHTSPIDLHSDVTSTSQSPLRHQLSVDGIIKSTTSDE
jgi:hypothetical protein